MAINEGTCGYNMDAKTGRKLTTPGGLNEDFIKESIKSVLSEKKKKLTALNGLKETIKFVTENNLGFTKEEITKEVQEIKKLGENLTEGLCTRGKNYIAARKRAGEKSSAYLSGRGVKVCKGQIKGSDGKRKKG